MTPGEDKQPKTLDAWLTLKQADLMLAHLDQAQATFPEVPLYLNGCVTALRSVTLVLQKALAPEPGFREWYDAEVRARLQADEELQYLKRARNYVLKEGTLPLRFSLEFGSTGEFPAGWEVRGVGPEGPDVWVADPSDATRQVPVDWRRLDGFYFKVHLRLGDAPGLPRPPQRELKQMLHDKIAMFDEILRRADDRFDPDAWTDEERGGG